MDEDYLSEDELQEKYGNPACYDDKDFYVLEKQIVKVTWEDACIEEAHIDAEFAKTLEPLLRHNVGFLLHKDEKKLIMYFGDLENFFKGNIATDMTLCLPIGIIKDITYLR